MPKKNEWQNACCPKFINWSIYPFVLVRKPLPITKGNSLYLSRHSLLENGTDGKTTAMKVLDELGMDRSTELCRFNMCWSNKDSMHCL